MTTGERSDPYLDFRFHVELSGLIVGGFSEVDGLEVELETEEYQEGGVNRYSHTLPVRHSYSNLTLRRGLTDSSELWDWMRRTMFGAPELRSGRIILLNNYGEEVRGWGFRDGYPVRWEGPDLSADQGSVAMESLEIAHHGLEQLSI